MGAGSGGATGQTSLEVYQKETHSMLLRGRSTADSIAAGVDWEGAAEADVYANSGSYADNPSVLRFVYDKGITDAGGNPFEGVSAYEPDSDLDSTDTDVAAFLTEVEALSPATDWQTFLSTALANVGSVIEELDVETIIDSIITRAITMASNVAAQSTADAQMIADTVNTAVRAKASTLATEQLDLAVTEGSADGVDIGEASDTAAEVTLNGVAGAVNGKVTSIADGNIQSGILDAEGEVTEVVGNGVTNAGTIIDASISKGSDTADDVVSDGSVAAVTVTSAAVDTAKNLASAISDTVESAARDAASTSMTSVMGDISPDVDDIIFKAVMGLKATVRDIMSEANMLALEVVDSTQVAGAVEAYRKRLLRVHLRSVNRFAGGMADIGAVNSSAFIVGMALLESDQQDNVAEFQSRLELELYTQVMTSGMNQYVETLKSVVTQYMDSYERRFAQTLEVYKINLPTYVQTFLSIVPEYTRVYMQSFMDYLSTFNNTVGQGNQLAVGSAQLESNASHVYSEVRNRLASELTRLQVETAGRTSALSAGIADRRLDVFARSAEQEAGMFERTFATGAQSTLGIMSGELESTIRSRLVEKNGKYQVAMGGAQLMTGMQGSRIDFRHRSSVLLEQVNRSRIIAKSEEYAKNLLYDVNSSNWDIELYQKASNVLAGVSGAVVASAGKPSDAQTVLGSMIAGGSIGAGYGALGGVPGAVVGAGVGLVAGGLAAAFD